MHAWRVLGVYDDLWISPTRPEGERVEILSPSLAAWRVDDWFAPLAGRSVLVEILNYLGDRAASGVGVSIESMRARVRGALREGRLVAFKREYVVHATPIRRVDEKRKEVAPTEKKTWVAIQLVDDDGNPVRYKRYRITLPDQSDRTGILDENGFARVNDIDPGTCKVTFPDFDGADWKAA